MAAFLTLAAIAMMLPTTASAGASAILPGTGSLNGGQADHVYFGGYKQDRWDNAARHRPDGVTLDLNGQKLTCGTLTIGDGAKVIVSEGQTLTIGTDGDIKSIVNNGELVVNGSLVLDDTKLEGDGTLRVNGNLTLSGASTVGNVRLGEGATITIDESFKADGVTGTIYLPEDCYREKTSICRSPSETAMKIIS